MFGRSIGKTASAGAVRSTKSCELSARGSNTDGASKGRFCCLVFLGSHSFIDHAFDTHTHHVQESRAHLRGEFLFVIYSEQSTVVGSQ